MIKLRTLILFFLLVFNGFTCSAQEWEDSIKGDWVFASYQSFGDWGMSNEMAEMSIGDTLRIKEKIKLLSKEENEFTNYLKITGEICSYNPISIKPLVDNHKYFIESYKLNPILLGITNSKKVVIIETDCKDKIYQLLFYNLSDEELIIADNGMFFILNRIK